MAGTYFFDVFTAQHDDVKMGGDYPRLRSRVIVAAETYPEAMTDAALMAVARHGGMPVAVLPRF